MTPEQIRELSDEDLNLKMMENYWDKEWFKDKDIVKARKRGHFDYLKDWNITMPLAVENMLKISIYKNAVDIESFCGETSKKRDPSLTLRAICEVLLMIKLSD